MDFPKFLNVRMTMSAMDRNNIRDFVVTMTATVPTISLFGMGTTALCEQLEGVAMRRHAGIQMIFPTHGGTP